MKREPENNNIEDDMVEVSTAEHSGFEEYDENTSARLNPTYDERLDEFLALCEVDASEVKYWLYKYDNYLQGEKKALMDEFTDGGYPTQHQVGLKYGSGRYMLMASIPGNGKRKKQMRGYKFRIHQIYDDRLVGSSRPNSNQPPPVFMEPRKDTSMIDALTLVQGMFTQMMQCIIPLVRPSESPDMAKLMNQNFDFMNQAMKKQMMNNVELMSDYQKKYSELNPDAGENMIDDDEKDDIVSTVIEKVAPYLDKFLPLLARGGQKGTAVASVVKNTAMFRDIQKNRAAIDRLIEYLDQNQGVTVTNKVLKMLSIKRPFKNAQRLRDKLSKAKITTFKPVTEKGVSNDKTTARTTGTTGTTGKGVTRRQKIKSK